MRAVARGALPAALASYLARRTASLAAAGNTAAKAKAAWPGGRRTKKVKAAFAILVDMNGGSRRCMYCEHDRGSDIDHFNPHAVAPALTFAWGNWVLACGECNRRKNRRFPPGLLNPTAPGYRPDVHFEFLPATGAFDLKTPEAVASEPVFGLNEEELKRSRHRVFALYQAAILSFADAKSANEAGLAAYFRSAIVGGVHPSVLATIRRWHSGPGRAFLQPACAAAIDEWPEILAW